MYLNSYLIYMGFEKAGYSEVTLHLLRVQKCTSCNKPYTKMNIMLGCLKTNTYKIKTQRRIQREILQGAVNQTLINSSASYLYISFIPILSQSR